MLAKALYYRTLLILIDFKLVADEERFELLSSNTILYANKPFKIRLLTQYNKHKSLYKCLHHIKSLSHRQNLHKILLHKKLHNNLTTQKLHTYCTHLSLSNTLPIIFIVLVFVLMSQSILRHKNNYF